MYVWHGCNICLTYIVLTWKGSSRAAEAELRLRLDNKDRMIPPLQSASRYRDFDHAKKAPSRSVEQRSFWSKSDSGADNTVTPVNGKNSLPSPDDTKESGKDIQEGRVIGGPCR